MAIVLGAGGCAVGNRFVLTSSDRFAGTPAQFDVPYDDVCLASGDIRLNGWYAAGSPAMPLMLMFHGNAGSIGDCLEYVRLFHKAGFSVCLFDYRGYGLSSGESIKEEELYEDARRMVAFAKARGWNSERMIYYGQSMGSAIALQMALEDPPAGLVLESPFTSFADIAAYHVPVAYPLLGRFLIDLAFENNAKIGRLQAPLLLIHGDSDQVVPVEMSIQLFDRARTDKALCLIRDGRHCDGFAVGKGEVMPVIRRFAVEVAG